MIVGLLVVAAGLVSSAAIINGFTAYLGEFVQLDRITAIIIVTLAIGAIAAWGIAESVSIAAFVTLVEIAGVWQVQYLYACGALTLLNAALYVTISLAGTPAVEKPAPGLWWTPGYWRRETETLAGRPWHGNYRILSALLIVVTAILLGFRWESD